MKGCCVSLRGLRLLLGRAPALMARCTWRWLYEPWPTQGVPASAPPPARRITSIQPPSSGTATCPVLNSASTSSCSDSSLTVSSYRLPASVRPEYLQGSEARRLHWLSLTLPEMSVQPSIHAWPVSVVVVGPPPHTHTHSVPISQIRKLQPQRRGNWAPEPNVGTKCARPNHLLTGLSHAQKLGIYKDTCIHVGSKQALTYWAHSCLALSEGKRTHIL